MHPPPSTSRASLAITLAATLALAACATGGAGRPTVDPDRITQEELTEFGGTDVLSAIQSLRPRWLRGRYVAGRGTIPIAVYVDDLVQNEPADVVLRRIPLVGVREIRYVGPSEAEGRFGGFAGGAILVFRRESVGGGGA